MHQNKPAIVEAGLQVLACPRCQSAGALELQEDGLRCRGCQAAYPVIDDVLDLMPPNYNDYPGDSREEAIRRDAHNRRALRQDTLRLRRALDPLLQSKVLLLDAGCGTGQLTRLIAETHPNVSVIATDVSLDMCRLAASNCRGLPVWVVRTPTSLDPPMAFGSAVFDLVLNRLAPMEPAESFRMLRPGGYAVQARLVDAHWQEIRQIFPKERLITFPEDLEPKEALFQAGFVEAESHAWRYTKTHPLADIVTVLSFAPVVLDFDETADRPFLNKLEAMYGEPGGIRLTEGEALVIGRKGS